MDQKPYKFTVIGMRWFDKVNGNTYHSCRIIKHSDNSVICCQFQYGYGDQYRQTALKEMVNNKWIPEKYKGKEYLYERENGYNILWNVSDNLKREVVQNGKA